MESAEEDRSELRTAAVESLVFAAVGLALQLAAMVVITKRDWVRRQFLRYRWHVLREWRGAHERQLVAELLRDISAWEHREASGGH